MFRILSEGDAGFHFRKQGKPICLASPTGIISSNGDIEKGKFVSL